MTLSPHHISICLLIRNCILYFDEKLANFLYLEIKKLCTPNCNLADNPSGGDLLPAVLRTLSELKEFLLDKNNNITSSDKIFSYLFEQLSSIQSINDLYDLMENIKTLEFEKQSIFGLFLREVLVNYDDLMFDGLLQLFNSVVNYRNEAIESLRSDNNDLKDNSIIFKRVNLSYSQLYSYTYRNMYQIANTISGFDIQRISYLVELYPDFAQLHYCHFLYFLYTHQFENALSKLHQSFDYKWKDSNQNDLGIGPQHAILNLSLFYQWFGMNNEAFHCILEAIRAAQQHNDQICLSQALFLLHSLSSSPLDTFDILRFSKSSINNELSVYNRLNSIYSTLISKQLFFSSPSSIFNMLSNLPFTDFVAHSRDLLLQSFIWQTFGFLDLSSLYQLVQLSFFKLDSPESSVLSLNLLKNKNDKSFLIELKKFLQNPRFRNDMFSQLPFSNDFLKNPSLVSLFSHLYSSFSRLFFCHTLFYHHRFFEAYFHSSSLLNEFYSPIHSVESTLLLINILSCADSFILSNQLTFLPNMLRILYSTREIPYLYSLITIALCIVYSFLGLYNEVIDLLTPLISSESLLIKGYVYLLLSKSYLHLNESHNKIEYYLEQVVNLYGNEVFFQNFYFLTQAREAYYLLSLFYNYSNQLSKRNLAVTKFLNIQHLYDNFL